MDFNGKRLYRKKYDRTFLGICGGLGEYFNVDPVIFRIIFVALFLGGSVGFWLYLLMALIIPEEPDTQE